MSKLFDLGLMTPEAAKTCLDAAKGLSTIRMVFPDQHGVLRGKTLTVDALPSALKSGIKAPSTLLLKDTSHRTVFPVWEADGAPSALQGAGDVLLVPDPDSLTPLPWSENSAWLFARPVLRDGSAVPFTSETVLERAMTALAKHNMQLRIGLEVEFHVFEIDDPALDHANAAMPNDPVKTRNIAPGFQFLTEHRFDRVSSVLEMLRAPLQAIGLPLQSLELEMGPSQLELTFAPDAPDVQARRMIMLRTAVKEICARAGLHASFMCRPVVENAAASGWHIHQSVLADDGTNLMAPNETGISPTASSWMAGLLKYAEATCLLTTPTVNGYKRYQPFQLAPDRICWGRDNRGAMIRALFDESPQAARIENRVAEPAANPYFVFAAQIHAGLAGLNEGLTAPAPVEASYSADVPRLPTDMGTAIQAFEASDFVKSVFGSDFAQYYTTLKRAEWTRYLAALSDWEAREYFDLF